jgi:hypothetical protein
MAQETARPPAVAWKIVMQVALEDISQLTDCQGALLLMAKCRPRWWRATVIDYLTFTAAGHINRLIHDSIAYRLE